MSEDRVIIVCIRVEDASIEGIVAGSKQVPCSDCGKKCWQSPQTVNLEGDIVCMKCAGKRMKKESEERIKRGEDPEVEIEITDEVWKATMDWIWKAMGGAKN